jgi:hypothetical protein
VKPSAVTVRRVDPPALADDTMAVVPDVLLPMLWWPDVPVRREVSTPLTALECFVLETALSLGAVTASEFTEVTSLPGQVLGGVAAGLVVAGALRPGGNGYAVVPEVAEPAARERAIVRRSHGAAGFVVLPRHGDVLGMPAAGGWLAEMERRRPRPAVNAPVPRALWGTGRDRFLAERVRAGGVPGMDPTVVAVEAGDDDTPLAASAAEHEMGMCPAYRCRAWVRGLAGDRPSVHAVISAAPAPGAGSPATAGHDPDPADPGAGGTAGPVEVEADLTGADALVRHWMSLAEAIADPLVLRVAWRQLCPPGLEEQVPSGLRRIGPAEWEIPVSGITAAALTARGEDLTRPVGLAVEGDGAAVHIACRFVRREAGDGADHGAGHGGRDDATRAL